MQAAPKARRPATAHRPASARRLPRPSTSHGAGPDPRATPGRAGGGAGKRVQELVQPLAEGLGWEYYQQNEEVSRLKERIAQLELKLLAEGKAAPGARAGGRAGGGPAAAAARPPAERELLAALQWARSEAEVFAGIDMAAKPGEQAVAAVLQQMLANAGAGGVFTESKVKDLACEVFVTHANSFTRRLDLQKLRALVARQHRERARKRIEDWVRASTDYQQLVVQCVQKGRGQAPLREALETDVVASLDHVQTDISQTMRVCHRAYTRWSALRATALRVDASSPSARFPQAETPMKFGVAEAALVPLQEGLRHVRAYHKGLEHQIGLPAAEARQQMAREHASEELFRDVTHGITTSAAKEWAHVLGTATSAEGANKEGGEPGGGRQVVSLDELMQLQDVVSAALSEEEVLGLRLYSGPMHDVYNEVLRSTLEVAALLSHACSLTTVCVCVCFCACVCVRVSGCVSGCV